MIGPDSEVRQPEQLLQLCLILVSVSLLVLGFRLLEVRYHEKGLNLPSPIWLSWLEESSTMSFAT